MANKKNELATVNKGNALQTLASVHIGDNIGACGAETVLDKDGNSAYVVVNRDKDGEEVTTTYIPTKESASILRTIDALRVAKTLTDVVSAHHFFVAYSREIWRDMGYKSFAAFAEHFAGIKGNTARLYSRVGEYFIKEEEGTIDYRRSWLSGVSVSNLFPVLSLFEKLLEELTKDNTMDEDVARERALDELYTRFIDESKLHLRFAQSRIKEEVSAIMGNGKPDGKKDGKPDGKKDGKEGKEALPNALTSYGIVEAEVTARLGESDDVETVTKALELIKAILTR